MGISPEPEIADYFLHIVNWFWDLNASRSQGFDGPLPLTFSELSAWREMTGEMPSREELSIIRQMDQAYLSALAKEREDQRARSKDKQNG